MSRPEFFLGNAVYTLLCNFVALRSHCEAQFRVYLELIQPSDTEFPKQSPWSDFVVISEQGDCRVACFILSHHEFYCLLSLDIDAPRNDKWKRPSEFAPVQTQMVVMAYVAYTIAFWYAYLTLRGYVHL
jgi:hypothetical protein